MLMDFDELGSSIGQEIDEKLLKSEFEVALSLADAAKAQDEGAALRAICKVNFARGYGPGVGTGPAADALKAAGEAVAFSRSRGDVAGEAASTHLVAKAQILAKKESEAMKAVEDALTAFRKLGHKLGEASASATLAKAYILARRPQKAVDIVNEALMLFRDLGERRGEAMALEVLIETNIAVKRPLDAIDASTNMFELFSSLRDINGQGIAKLLSIDALVANGDKREALAAAKQAAQLFNKSGDKRKVALAKQAGAEAALAMDMEKEALDMAEAAMMGFRSMGDKTGQAAALITMANVYSACGEFAKATYRAEAASELYKNAGSTSEAAAALRTTCLVYLDQKQYDPDAPASVTREAVRTALASVELYRKSGEAETAGNASSLQTLACAWLALNDAEKTMETALESKRIFEKLGNNTGVASCLNTVAQVHKQRKDIPEALNAAREAHRLFEEEQDVAGAEVAAFLIGTLEAGDGESAQRTATEDEDRKNKAPPGKVESRCQLADFIPGGLVPSITILTAYDTYEGRNVGGTGKRVSTEAEDAKAAQRAKEEAFVTPVYESAGVFNVRWLPANLIPDTAPPPGQPKKVENRVLRQALTEKIGPGGLVPVAKNVVRHPIMAID